MAGSTTLICLLGFVAIASSTRIFDTCNFEDSSDPCGLVFSNAFEQGNGRPSWNNNAMDSGYSGSGYLLLTKYNSEYSISTPTLMATKGDEEINFAYFINGEGENDAYIRVYVTIGGGEEQFLWEADLRENKWQYISLQVNAAVGEEFQVVFKAEARRNIWTTQHTWLGLDLIDVVNEGGATKCFRPPPVLYANPWVCSSNGKDIFRPNPREELSDGSICSTSCLEGFMPQGQPFLYCNNGQWEEEGEIVFLCLDTMAPEFENCPTDFDVTTPFGWGSMWYTINPPKISDNTNAWTLQLFVNEQLQTASTMTTEIFPGTYAVNFVATDLNYNQNSCSYTVTVVTGDQSPPVVTSCPRSTSVESASPAIVGWSDPVFVDDSGYIAKVESNYLPTDLMAWGTHEVVYTAYDNSSNTGVCSFSVTIRGLPCNILNLPSNGALVCHDSYSGRFCVTMCDSDGDFELSSQELTVPDEYLCSTSGSWYPYEFIYNCLAPYGDSNVKSADYYYSGACNETATQDVMKSQALNIYDLADVDSTMGENLTPNDFYVTCGPKN